MTTGIIIAGILYALVMAIWTKFNYDEAKFNNNRTDAIIADDDRKENTYKRIKQIDVHTIHGEKFSYTDARAYGKDDGGWHVINEEGKSVAIFERREVRFLELHREENATYNEVLR